MMDTTHYLRGLQLSSELDHDGLGVPDIPGLASQGCLESLDDPSLEEIAQLMSDEEVDVDFIRGFATSGDPVQGTRVEHLRQKILQEFSTTVFCGRTGGNPPVRGPQGEAEITLKPGAQPLKQRPYQMTGDRRAAWVSLTDQLIRDGKIEPGHGPWSSPSFPVPKKKPGQWWLVVDYRALNEATVTDAHPLPRIGDILQRQGKYKIWSVLDMKDGYHQVPLKP